MSCIHGRFVPLVLGTGAFLAVLMHSQPTTSSISETRPSPPTRSEVLVLEELHQWVEGTYGEDPRPLARHAIGAAMRQRPESFELFRSYHPRTERRRLLRELPYGDLLARSASRHGIDGLLLAAIVEAESSFNPYAISVDGALGLTQILPTTANLPADELLTPRVNVDAGAGHLAELLRRFGGDFELAVAAYNAGPGAVYRFDGVPPYRETRAYVSRVLGRYLEHQQTLWRDYLRRDWYLE